MMRLPSWRLLDAAFRPQRKSECGSHMVTANDWIVARERVDEKPFRRGWVDLYGERAVAR
jgi:hypothetical protein